MKLVLISNFVNKFFHKFNNLSFHSFKNLISSLSLFQQLWTIRIHDRIIILSLYIYIYLIQVLLFEKFSPWNPTINSSINAIIIVLLHLRHRINISPTYGNPKSFLNPNYRVSAEKKEEEEEKQNMRLKLCVLSFFIPLSPKVKRRKGKKEGNEGKSAERLKKLMAHLSLRYNTRLTIRSTKGCSLIPDDIDSSLYLCQQM